MTQNDHSGEPPADDPGAIDFKWTGPDPEPAPDPAHAPGPNDDLRAATPAAPEPFVAPPPVAAPNLEIKWRDEDQSPPAGHPFAEVAHEPPLAPFKETLRAPSSALRASSLRPSRWLRWFWGFMPLTLLLLGSGSVLLTQHGVGHAWDEAYYYEPAQKAADWLSAALHGYRPFSKADIDSAWSGIHEHPSFQKILSGISLSFFPELKSHLFAMRLPIALLFGLTLSLIYLLGRRAWGAVPGLIAALLYATMPRVFGHAHFASMETPLVFVMLLTVYCFLRGLEFPRWSVFTGIAFGLLLSTKINGFFLPIPLILWAHLYARPRYVNNLFAMLFLGPVVFVLTWPWLWPDPVMRLLEYLAFHAQHQQTAVFFLGQKWGYGGANAPWYYPWVITGVTLPLTAILLIAWGLLRTLLALPRRPIEALYLLCALTMLGVASAPGTPKYDGERLFLPAFAFLALLGGSGSVALLGLMQRLFARVKRTGAGEAPAQHAGGWAAVALALLVLLDGGSAIWRYHPYLLSYFNPLVGGLPGAFENRLFESTYWGEALNEDVITALNALPPGTAIKPLALHAKCLEDLQLWGLLDQDLRIDKPKRALIAGQPLDYYDAHLLLMRQGFFTRPERALAERNRFPGKLWKKFDVPMIGLYQTGPEFELFWREIPQ